MTLGSASVMPCYLRLSAQPSTARRASSSTTCSCPFHVAEDTHGHPQMGVVVQYVPKVQGDPPHTCTTRVFPSSGLHTHFDHVCLGMVDPLPPCSGHQLPSIAMGRFMEWPAAFPMPNATDATNVCIILKLGCPFQCVISCDH